MCYPWSPHHMKPRMPPWKSLKSLLDKIDQRPRFEDLGNTQKSMAVMKTCFSSRKNHNKHTMKTSTTYKRKKTEKRRGEDVGRVVVGSVRVRMLFIGTVMWHGQELIALAWVGGTGRSFCQNIYVMLVLQVSRFCLALTNTTTGAVAFWTVVVGCFGFAGLGVRVGLGRMGKTVEWDNWASRFRSVVKGSWVVLMGSIGCSDVSVVLCSEWGIQAVSGGTGVLVCLVCDTCLGNGSWWMLRSGQNDICPLAVPGGCAL
ncbi:hypothetical protein Tco_0675854 [Tanacetum coccineum]